MNPLMPAMMAQAGENSLGTFLDDFNELFDTEWPFLLALVVCSFSFLAVVVSMLVVRVNPDPSGEVCSNLPPVAVVRRRRARQVQSCLSCASERSALSSIRSLRMTSRTGKIPVPLSSSRAGS